MSGTVEIALEESGGSATGPMEISVASDTVVSASPSNCTGSMGPGIGNTFGCSVSGTPGNLACSDLRTFTFGQTTAQQTTAFSGALSGGAISGTVTYGIASQGSNPDGGTNNQNGSTTFPVTLR